jgi:hypothetical protein
MTRITIVVTLLSLAAPAQAWSPLGGETLRAGESGLHIQVGYPQITGKYHYGLLDDLELAPKLRFHYSPPGKALSPGTVIGGTIGADLRYELLETNGVHLGFLWKFGVLMNFTEPFGIGMELLVPGGIRVGWEVVEDIVLVGGLNVTVLALFEPEQAFLMPIDFDLGAEIGLTPEILFTVQFAVGPVLIVPEGDAKSSVGLDLSGSIGIGYRL